MSQVVLDRRDSDGIVGRVLVLTEAMERLDEHHGVVFAGPAGVGKTRLLREVAERVERGGTRIVSLQATASTASIPFGVFLSVLATPSTPKASLIDNGLSRSVGQHQALTLVHVASVIHSRLIGAAAVAVDDAHLLDPASAGLLLDLARAGLSVVATVRDGEPVPDAIAALWRGRYAPVVRVPPLEEAESHHLVTQLLDAPVDRGLSRAVHEKSGGNPLIERELVRGAVESGVAGQRNGVWVLAGRLPALRSVTELLAEHIEELDEALRGVVDVVALAETLALDDALALLSEDDLERAERRGLVRVQVEGESHVVRLAHPLYRDAVLGDMPSLGRTRIYRQLAGVVRARARSGPLSDTERVALARWSLEEGHPPPVDELVSLAELVHSSDEALCDRFITAALEAPRRLDDVIRLATLLAHRHRLGEAEELLTAIDWPALSAEARVRIVTIRAYLLIMVAHDPATALEMIDAAIAELGAEPLLVAHRASALWAAGRIAEGRVDGLSVLDDESAAPDPRVLAATVLGMMDISRGDSAGYARARGIALPLIPLAKQIPEAENTFHLQDVLHLINVVQDVTRAEALARAHYESALRRGNDSARTEFAHLIAWILALKGDLPNALPLFGEANAASGMWALTTRPWVGSHFVRALVLTGAIEAARAALHEVLRRPYGGFNNVNIALAEASVLAADGAMAEAGRRCFAAGELAAGLQQTERAAAAWFAGLRYGDNSSAARLRDGLAGSGNPVDAAKVMLATAWLGGAAQKAEAASSDFEERGLLWYAIDSAALAVVLHHRGGDDTRAPAAVARVAALRQRASGLWSPTAHHLTVPTALTPRELTVAMLAAGGKSNGEIAVELGISVRTVTTHLERIFAKLGIAKRSQLGGIVSP